MEPARCGGRCRCGGRWLRRGHAGRLPASRQLGRSAPGFGAPSNGLVRRAGGRRAGQADGASSKRTAPHPVRRRHRTSCRVTMRAPLKSCRRSLRFRRNAPFAWLLAAWVPGGRARSPVARGPYPPVYAGSANSASRVRESVGRVRQTVTADHPSGWCGCRRPPLPAAGYRLPATGRCAGGGRTRRSRPPARPRPPPRRPPPAPPAGPAAAAAAGSGAGTPGPASPAPRPPAAAPGPG